jgi:phenylacetate-coenzyme A ligase PaaK-like adenylate-forming protein
VADVPLHMTARMARTLDVGVHRMLRLDARRPVSELVGPLNAFAPEGLTAYASVAALLADEQLAGRLRIAPQTVAVTSEVLTADMRERIEAAWGSTPFNGYASTETGMLATSCERHEGLHVLSDLNLLEVVDTEGRPVAPGTQGAKVLVTNLVNRTQPLIRMELSDLVTVSPATCSCGRPYPLLETVDGRSDDILVLPAAGGGTVSVHPLTLRSPLAALPDLRQYRIVHDASGLTVEAVIGAGNGETGAEIERRLTAALAERGAGGTPVTVTQVEAIERHPGSGKAKLVESRV